MNHAEEIVALLSKEELRNFRLLALRTNDRQDRKDLILLDALRQSGYDDDKLLKRLYPTEDKNSFYRLKNRLVTDLGKSLLLLHSDRSAFHLILNELMLGRIFREKGNIKLAQNYFLKAEKHARSADLPELLDLVYSELIKLSQDSLDIPPDLYIRKRKENRVILSSLHEIDDILAAVIYRIKTAQTFNSRNENIIKILEKTINAYLVNKDTKHNKSLRMRMYQAVSRILLQRQDYVALEEYLVKTYSEFIKDGLFTRENHELKLQMLVYLVNSLFRNGKHEQSLKFTQQLNNGLKEYDRLLYRKYLFYYYSGLVINYTATDKLKAIDTLLHALDDPEIRKVASNVQFLRLNLAVVYFDLKDFKASLKNLVKIYNDEHFNNLDDSFRLKIFMAELIIRFELGDQEYILHRAAGLRKEFHRSLADEGHNREKLLLEFIVQVSRNDKKLKVQDVKDLVKGLSSNTSNDVINYSEWLADHFLKKRK